MAGQLFGPELMLQIPAVGARPELKVETIVSTVRRSLTVKAGIG
jgi:hypothetical protein